MAQDCRVIGCPAKTETEGANRQLCEYHGRLLDTIVTDMKRCTPPAERAKSMKELKSYISDDRRLVQMFSALETDLEQQGDYRPSKRRRLFNWREWRERVD